MRSRRRLISMCNQEPRSSNVWNTGFTMRMSSASSAADTGFQEATVLPVVQTIRNSETRDYVRAQLIATPQAGLLSTTEGKRREAIIDAIAADMKMFLSSEDGGFASF